MQLVQRTFSRECNVLWQWTRRYQIPPTVRCEAWFCFCRHKTLDPVKFTGLVVVYGEHVMNVASVRKWCTMFRNGRTDVHDAERSGRPSVITDALKQKVNHIIRENRHFTISEVYKQCPEVSRTVVYEIFNEHLQYSKICARWVPRPSGTRRE